MEGWSEDTARALTSDEIYAKCFNVQLEKSMANRLFAALLQKYSKTDSFYQ